MRKTQPIEKEVVPMKVYSDSELKLVDEEIQTNFNGLRTREAYMLYVTRCGGGSIVSGMLHAQPSAMPGIDDKIRQWSWWRRRNHPFDIKKAFSEYRALVGGLAKAKLV